MNNSNRLGETLIPQVQPKNPNQNYLNDNSRWVTNKTPNQIQPQQIQPIPNNQNYPGVINNISFINLSKTPYDLSNLSNDKKSLLKNHSLGYTILPLTIIFGIVGILGSWFFGITVHLWSSWILMRHHSILSQLPRIDERSKYGSYLPFIAWLPLFNFLIIPFSQDEIRRQLNLQFSLRDEMLPFSRSQINTTSWLQSLSILFVLPLIVFASSMTSLYDWEFSVVSLFWHIPVILLMTSTLIFLVKATDDSKIGWWPDKINESKSGRDLIESTSIPLLITTISVFIMMIIILPIYGGNSTSNMYEMQMWIFFPTLLTLFFGLTFKQDYTKQKIASSRGGEYLLYCVVLTAFSIIPYIFIVVVWISMIMMLIALIMMLLTEISISTAINSICFHDGIKKSWDSKKPQPNIISPKNKFANNQIPQQQFRSQKNQQIQQQFQQQIQANPINELTNTRNRFTKTQRFASGGMANVFHCIDNENGEVRVWKQAQGVHIPLNDANKRLKYEAEVLMLADHPRIPKYFGFTDVKNNEGKDENVVIMEYLEGGDLKSTVTQISKVGLIMPADTIINYLKEMCEPLIHMSSFQEPIYHRDLKPHNIIIHPTRGPVIIDWGLAKAVHGGSDISVTRGGSGTWTSPERDSGISGPFTDVYSLGKILYYLATCKQPPAIISNSEKEEMISLGHPVWLAELMLKASWPRHQERIQNTSEFLQLLVNEGEEESTEPVEAMINLDDLTKWG